MKHDVNDLRFLKLARRLHSQLATSPNIGPKAMAVGVLEMLWHMAINEDRGGEVGHCGNRGVAAYIEWPGDADDLVKALVDCEWLRYGDDGRLFVYDYQAIRKGRVGRSYRPWRLEISAAQWIALRTDIIARDGLICAYCGIVVDAPHIDHIVPVSRGGLSQPDNLVVSCRDCNIAKSDMTPEEWRARRG